MNREGTVPATTYCTYVPTTTAISASSRGSVRQTPIIIIPIPTQTQYFQMRGVKVKVHITWDRSVSPLPFLTFHQTCSIWFRNRIPHPAAESWHKQKRSRGHIFIRKKTSLLPQDTKINSGLRSGGKAGTKKKNEIKWPLQLCSQPRRR